MHAHVSLLGIALLPLLAGVTVLLLGPAWRRWFGAERATAVAGRFALGGTLLAVFLLAAALYGLSARPDLEPTQPVAWAFVGFTTMLGLDLEIEGMTLVLAGQALIVALVTMLAGLVDARGGAAALGRAAALLGTTLLLAMGSTVWAAAIAWQVAVLVAGASGLAERTGASGQVAEDRSRGWARLTDAGVWLAVLAVAVGAGDLSLPLVTRGALFGAGASLVTSGMATLATCGLAVAVIGRALELPAAVRGEAPASRAALLGLASAAGVLLLLRMHVVIAMAPRAMAGLALAGGLLAAWAGLRAAQAGGRDEALARLSQATIGLMLVACGMGAWVAAVGLALAHGLVAAGLALGGAWRPARWIGGLALGLLPLGAGLWLGEVAGAAFMFLSAWSPAINFALAGLVVLAAAGIGAGVGAVVRDRFEGTGPQGQVAGDRPEAGLYAGLGALLAGLGALAAAIDVPGVAAGLRVWVSPTFGMSWLLEGDFALGPRPGYSIALARGGALVTIAAAWVGWLWLRVRVPAPAWSGEGLRRRWWSLCRGLHELIEVRLLGVMLRPGEIQAARAGGPPELARALLGVLAGAAVLLGAVYCNPDVTQLGPSRTYPVDAGGIDPALLGSRRAGTEEAP
jgi:hypothetical protein